MSDWVGWSQTPLGVCHAYPTFFLVLRCRHLHRPTFMPNNNKAQHFTHSFEHPIGCGSVAYNYTLRLRDAFTPRWVCCRVRHGSHTWRIWGRCERYSFGVYVALILGRQLLMASHLDPFKPWATNQIPLSCKSSSHTHVIFLLPKPNFCIKASPLDLPVSFYITKYPHPIFSGCCYLSELSS